MVNSPSVVLFAYFPIGNNNIASRKWGYHVTSTEQAGRRPQSTRFYINRIDGCGCHRRHTGGNCLSVVPESAQAWPQSSRPGAPDGHCPTPARVLAGCAHLCPQPYDAEYE